MIDIEGLQARGWIHIQHDEACARDTLLRLASKLGKSVPARQNYDVVQALSPASRQIAHPNSLSALHGEGAFPLHTDTAHWPTPARYILFHSKNPGEARRSTFFTPMKSVIIKPAVDELISRALFKVVNGRRSFLTSIKENLASNIARFRYDPGCMKPANPSACEAIWEFSRTLDQVPTHEIRWQTGDILIIDNWTVLHGRRQVDGIVDQSRVLERILIQEDT